jgi:hypothetical protein
MWRTTRLPQGVDAVEKGFAGVPPSGQASKGFLDHPEGRNNDTPTTRGRKSIFYPCTGALAIRSTFSTASVKSGKAFAAHKASVQPPAAGASEISYTSRIVQPDVAHHCHRPLAPARLSPGGAHTATFGRRLQRRDVDGAIRRSRADDRRLEGERDGLKIQGARRDRFPQGVSNGVERETAERHRADRARGRPQLAASSQDAVDADAERQSVGAGNRPLYGCGVGVRVPVAPSPASCQRGWWCWAAQARPAISSVTRRCDSHRLESALAAIGAYRYRLPPARW